jgi:5-methylcytosine-specific restriction endonuclease McrA
MISATETLRREKIRKAMLGKRNALGTKHTAETRKRMSEAKKGQPVHEWAESSREKMRQAHLGRKHSESTKKKMSSARKAENHWNWQGGKSRDKRSLGNPLYVQWRTMVFERDDYTCVDCGLRSGNGKRVTLNADHIKPWAHYPELRFDLNNGRTLCIDCHKATDTYGFKLIKRKEDPSYGN